MPAISGLVAGNTPAARANNVAVVNNVGSLGGDTLEFPKGTFYFDVNGIYSQFDGMRYYGKGEGATKLVAVGSGALFDTSGFPRQTFAGMTIQGYGNHTGGSVIRHWSSTQGGNNFKAHDLTFEACHDGIECVAFNSVHIERVNMVNMRGGFGVRASGPAASQRCDLLRIKGLVYSANPSYKVASQAHGVIVEGFVNTINWSDLNITNPWRGILVHNPYGLPYSQGPKLIVGNDVKVDYPTVQAMILNGVEEAFFDQSYFHGSIQEDNIMLDAACRQIKFSQSKITGAAKANLFTDADDTELIGNDYAYANCANGGQASIIFGSNSQTGRVIGGCAKGGNQTHGMANWNAGNGPNIVRVGTQHIMGVNGNESGF